MRLKIHITIDPELAEQIENRAKFESIPQTTFGLKMLKLGIKEYDRIQTQLAQIQAGKTQIDLEDAR